MTIENCNTACKNGRLSIDTPRALTRLEHVRAELAKVYRLARTGQMETQDATRLCYILTSLAKVISDSNLEARVKALETAKRANDGNK
ncbi:MAG: hypothetical protein PF441_00390 [Desulfuromusa sp.]|nr:hypothetical protein [Desulfuromusa sp.]